MFYDTKCTTIEIVLLRFVLVLYCHINYQYVKSDFNFHKNRKDAVHFVTMTTFILKIKTSLGVYKRYIYVQI